MINFYFKKNRITRKPKIVFIGLQRGEKIYEELILGNNLAKTKNKKCFIIENLIFIKKLFFIISKLEKAYVKNDMKKIFEIT